MPQPLSDTEKKRLLAMAVGVDSYRIADVFPDDFVYRVSPPGGVDGPEQHYRRTYTIGKDNAVTLGSPELVMMRSVYEPVATMAEFALDDAAEFAGNEVIRTGKIFEVGEYQDRNFALTEQEADDAIAAFSPVNNDLEHKSTILDGKLGRLESVWRHGKDIMGKVAVPKWLNEVVGTDPIKTSLAWNIASKRIVGNGLVLHPRVKDAQLIAAFSAATNQGGSTVMPQTATKPDKKTGLLDWLKAKFADGDRPEGLEEADLTRVEFNDEEPATGAAPVTQPAQDQTQFAQAQATITSQGQTIEGLQGALLTNGAEAFFAAALRENKVVPAEKDALIAQFKQAALDDAKEASVACFSATGEIHVGSRLKALREGVEKRLPHNLTSEQLAVFTLPQAGDASKVAEQRMNEHRAAHGLPAKKEG